MNRLYHDPALATFYDIDNPVSEADAACLDLARDAVSVLDLGCGTGRLAARIAATGARVVGVDPAPAMLDIARGRPGGGAVRWIEGDARTLRLAERFDLIVMTGHVFQVFLTAEDRAAVLATIAAHLAPSGRAVFESRNPAHAEWRHWTPTATEEVIEHPLRGLCRRWDDHSFDPESGICTYRTHYAPLGGTETFSAAARIAFPDPDEILSALPAAGLKLTGLWGDWQRGPFTHDSPEIIPLLSLNQTFHSG
jgi:SAM-dependent methyltransferase